jgi:hypothetical protein
MLVVPVLLAAAGAGALGWWRWQKRQPQAVEVEPNNDLGRATLIALGQPASGKIGQRLSDNTSDRDYYRLDLRGARGKLAARVSAIRNIDLALAVYDRAGKLLAMGDNVGLGEGEVVPNVSVGDDVLYVAVLESPEDSDDPDGPTENITDEYQLDVSVVPYAADEEVEPDDTDSDAVKIAPGKPMRGTLGRWRDVDRFRLVGPPGVYQIEVTGAETVPLKIRVGDAAPVKGRKLSAVLAADARFSLERDDPDRPKGAKGTRPVALGVDQPYTVILTPER